MVVARVLVDQLLTDVVGVAARQVRGHQPDQVTRAEPADPGIGRQPAGDEQGQHAKQVGEEQADPNRLFLLVARQFVGQRGDPQHVVDGKQTFEDDEAGND
jgi:hypothetical protein